VLRVYGFDRVPPTLPRIAGHDGPPTLTQRRRALVQDLLAAGGYAETINFAFYGRDADGLFPSLLSGQTGLTPLENPLSERYDVMRRSLVPGLLESALFNLRRGADATRLFEVGHVFGEWPAGSEPAPGESTEEIETFALLCGGRVGSPWDRSRDLDLFDLKGALEAVARAARPDTVLTARPAELPGVVLGTGATLWLGEAADAELPVGHLGQLDSHEVETPLYAAEMRLDALEGDGADRDREVTVPSRFPGVAADLTLTHPLAVSWAEIAASIGEWADGVDELQGFGLKDRYRGRGVPEGAVNTTMSFFYGSDERSLAQEEVNRRQRELAERLEEHFGLSSEEGLSSEGSEE
jgi:phenylalanyl-tRNA synthetase beta chain